MASLNDAPLSLRKHVRHIPDDILSRLSPGELRARLRHADSFDQRASREGIPEHFRYLKGHVKNILKAEPVVEHLAEVKRLNQLLDATPEQPREVHWALREQLSREKDNAGLHAPGLIEAVNGALLGQPTGVPEADNLADEIVRHRS
jgi:hypothetical protein